MNRPLFPSSPPSQPSPYRYLGRGGGDRPVRLQIIIALVAGLILVAVPLYLWRRPRPEPIPTADAAQANASVLALPIPLPETSTPAAVTLSPFTTIRCENPGPGKTAPERCDHVTFFEDALSRAIRENASCAPSGKTPVTVSFVLEMDFRRKRTNLYSGKSSTIKRAKAKELIKCIDRAMPKPDWGTIPHQYVKYKVNVIATYPPDTSL
ncbi:hypothetical protein [Chondromyces crocatus]|uniref:Uncharacterized protein n=1 Tax=Chondromyces crocatus TaxID=52 RepID=A0A0K1ECZ1_CHOCO|nr:hypothetical protein [Chondromyces crocatus]AKT38740.1 uncharacterized protein CMC5_028850 [Chondromyces crocatus]